MSTLRWEFRLFGITFRTVENIIIRNSTSHQEKKHDETYLIQQDTGLNFKIRLGFLDVKRLKEIDDTGFQLWEPLSKIDLPGQGIALNECFDICGLGDLFQDEHHYDEDDILRTLIRKGFIIVPLKKSRLKFEWDGLVGEYTHIETPDHCFTSIALESTDANLIKIKQKELQLETLTNQSYPEFLIALS